MLTYLSDKLKHPGQTLFCELWLAHPYVISANNELLDYCVPKTSVGVCIGFLVVSMQS